MLTVITIDMEKGYAVLWIPYLHKRLRVIITANFLLNYYWIITDILTNLFYFMLILASVDENSG